MAYLSDPEGKVKKRVLLRKDFSGDHLDELSAIVRGENRRDIMAPVRGWASSRKTQEPEAPPAQDLEVPNPGSPKTRKGRPPIPIDREALLALWVSNAPLWAIAKAFNVATNTIYVRAKLWGLEKRGHIKGTVKRGPKHGGT